mgnify:CR=1 FL=1
MKYLLILYMCSMNTGQCPSSFVSGYQFDTHNDCIYSGYGVAQQTFKNLDKFEEYNLEYLEKNKIVIKFECKQIGSKA